MYLDYYFNYFISYLFNFSVVLGYMIVDGSWCEPQKHTEYSSLDEAKDACNRDTDCTMFYNLQSKNQSYIICGSVYTIRFHKKEHREDSFFYQDSIPPGALSTLYKKCKNRALKLCNASLLQIPFLN